MREDWFKLAEKIVLEPNESGHTMPCPNCGINVCGDCGRGYTDYWGEFECDGPEDIDTCEDCYYAWCEECKKEEQIFSELSEKIFII